MQQVLRSLGLQRFFANIEGLAEQELRRHPGARDQAGAKQAVEPAWVAADLQSRVEVLLLQQYDPRVYRNAIALFSRREIVPIVQSCHGEGLEDYSSQLSDYQQQLQRQPVRPKRANLARQLDAAARTSKLAAQLHSRVEQRIYLASDGADAPAIRWQEVLAEREAVLQQAAETWYLYCGRYFSDELLQSMVDSYRQPAVQQLLDQYQAALDKVLPPAIVDQVMPVN